MSSQLSASLLRLKLLDALRSGDSAKVDALIASLSSAKSTLENADLIHLKETVLHYAVQVAPLATLQHLVENAERFKLSINAQDPDGNTPLHLAAASLRLEIVKYLLLLPTINDTIVNAKKKQPVELCKDLEIAQVMQFERAKFVERLSGQLRHFFSLRDFDSLEALLVLNPRASELLDINGADPDTGNTVLHEFIKKEDIQMCDWILKHGGDPFKRDKRGKLPVDLIQNKNEALRRLLKASSKDQTIMDPLISANNTTKAGGAPTYKGYLRKWTNFASGYKLRYFVLDLNGILSYYANQDDTNNACRGSLNLGFAQLHLDSSEKLKFEIIGKNGIGWHLKANHPIETNRWVWTLQNAITLAKDNLKKKRVALNPPPTRNSTDENAQGGISRSNSKNSTDENGEKKHRRLLRIPGRRSGHKRSASLGSQYSSDNEDEGPPSNPPSRNSSNASNASRAPSGVTASPNLSQIKEGKSLSPKDVPISEMDNNSYETENFDYDVEGGDFDSDSESFQRTGEDDLDLGDQVSTVKRSLDVEIASLLDLFKLAAGSSGEENSEVYSVGLKTLTGIQELFGKFNHLVATRDQKLMSKLDRQTEVNTLWESSIHQLEAEIAKREEKLAEYEGKKKQLKKYLSVGSKSGASTPVSNSVPPGAKEGGASKGYFAPAFVGGASGDVTEAGLGGINEAQPNILEEIFQDASDDEFFDASEFEEDEEDADVPHSERTLREDENVPSSAGVAIISDEKTESSQDKSEEVPQKEASGPYSHLNEAQKKKQTTIIEEGSFLGYDNPPRAKLAMDEDNRPKISLWGILKSMIGKDMTRMTLPVSFNEPTSLLQRLAEDIEYNHLLDTAAGYDDSTLRMVYVAAFAASEYASTINRIAKPFNPLLGETFEYCRKDQNFRLITEQVSHHPPISACLAESAKWDYYGENAVDSQLRVRSFDFKHLGKMFAVVRPDNGVIDTKGNRVSEELYSWKKVNTSVVGIIVGNPTVDNYGKMEVTNHTTGDVIVVDLKQRGWKASSAYQLSGHVDDVKGQSHWAIGGHWNSKIFAKKIHGSLNIERRDSLIVSGSEQGKVSQDPYSGNKFLVWEAAPRPTVPFNLTSFAITLNGVDETLTPWLAPTDTRLRPDQRAMEDGRYSEAGDEKHRVEEKQRAARKQRETNKEVYKPNWFIKKKHPITGDNFWEFQGKYWAMRKERQLKDAGDIF